ncbi:MAG: protein kinase [Eubacterium sp.]|nr:protein kinase [Eubacterium sp.]
MEGAKNCIYCMFGSISDGFCTRCGKPASEPNRPTEALPARYLLGRQYSIGRILGNGGFGITYLAFDGKNRRRVAVKELFPRYPRESFRRTGAQITVTGEERQYFDYVKKRFRQEAQALYELRNVPEIINVYHLLEENGTVYFVMEYLEGEDLKHSLARRGRMRWEELEEPLRMILRALDALHHKGLIHRDISPDNIFLPRGGGAKLIDFGAARDFTGNRELTAVLKGNFAPFEQFRSEKQGPWTDIYALSATLYFAMGGKLPVKATDRMVALAYGEKDPLLPIQALCPDLPPHVAKTLNWGMEVTAKQRPQTVAGFAERLFPGENGHAAQQEGDSQTGNGHCVRCVNGILKGRSVPLSPGVCTLFGRNNDCGVRYPVNSQGISRHQCSMMLDNKGIAYIRDENSSYGTYVNGGRLKPLVWQPVKSGSRIRFATEEYLVM